MEGWRWKHWWGACKDLEDVERISTYGLDQEGNGEK